MVSQEEVRATIRRWANAARDDFERDLMLIEVLKAVRLVKREGFMDHNANYPLAMFSTMQSGLEARDFPRKGDTMAKRSRETGYLNIDADHTLDFVDWSASHQVKPLSPDFHSACILEGGAMGTAGSPSVHSSTPERAEREATPAATAEDAAPVGASSSFPNTNVSLHDGGDTFPALCDAALRRFTRDHPPSSMKEENDIQFVKGLLSYICRVFGPEGFSSIKGTMTRLRHSAGLGQMAQPPPPADNWNEPPAEMQHFIYCLRRRDSLISKVGCTEYALCKTALELARSWRRMKNMIDQYSSEYFAFAQENEDAKTLKRQVASRNTEQLCLCSLAVQYRPDMKTSGGAIDEWKLEKVRKQMRADILASEQLMLFSKHFGDAIFLLFIPAWRKMLGHERTKLIRKIIVRYLIPRCPELPALIGNLAPIIFHLEHGTGDLPRFGFEVLSIDKSRQSLVSLLSPAGSSASSPVGL